MTQYARRYCTDCDEARGILRSDGRCPMCGGARVVDRAKPKNDLDEGTRMVAPTLSE